MSNLATFSSVGSATRTRRRLMRPTVFCPSRLRHFCRQHLLPATDFFRAAVALGIERPGCPQKSGVSVMPEISLLAVPVTSASCPGKENSVRHKISGQGSCPNL